MRGERIVPGGLRTGAGASHGVDDGIGDGLDGSSGRWDQRRVSAVGVGDGPGHRGVGGRRQGSGDVRESLVGGRGQWAQTPAVAATRCETRSDAAGGDLGQGRANDECHGGGRACEAVEVDIGQHVDGLGDRDTTHGGLGRRDPVVDG